MSNEQATRLLKKIVCMHEGRATAIKAPTLEEMKEIADFLNKQTPEPVIDRILNGDEFYYIGNSAIKYHVVKNGNTHVLEMKVTGGTVYEGLITGFNNTRFDYTRSAFGDTQLTIVHFKNIEFTNQ